VRAVPPDDESTRRELGCEELELRGAWGERGETDPVEQRIRWLVANRLVPLARADGGWEWLFRDPRDGRLWELTFPLGTVHGSGPRRLAVVSPEHASAAYDWREG
jgi:hypothetical protein